MRTGGPRARTAASGGTASPARYGVMRGEGEIASAPWTARVTGIPAHLRGAVVLDAAAGLAGRRAVGEADGPLERLDDLGDADGLGRAGEPVAAAAAARRGDEPGRRERLRELRDGRAGARATGPRAPAPSASLAPRQVGEEDDGVVRQPRHPDHPSPPRTPGASPPAGAPDHQSQPGLKRSRYCFLYQNQHGLKRSRYDSSNPGLTDFIPKVAAPRPLRGWVGACAVER